MNKNYYINPNLVPCTIQLKHHVFLSRAQIHIQSKYQGLCIIQCSASQHTAGSFVKVPILPGAWPQSLHPCPYKGQTNRPVSPGKRKCIWSSQKGYHLAISVVPASKKRSGSHKQLFYLTVPQDLNAFFPITLSHHKIHNEM